jgi:uncharacterized protein YndB with AHSA1/START domain
MEINAEPTVVYRYLTEQVKLSKWFAPQVIAVPVEGTTAAFAFEFDLNFKMEIIELKEAKTVKWRCVDGYDEWINSEVIFKINKKEKGTILLFEHNGLTNDEKQVKTIESWEKYLTNLKHYCEK